MRFLSRTVFAAAAAALSLAGAPQLAQAAETYTIDAAHTGVIFTIDHLGYSTLYGRFAEVSGTVEFDRDNPAASAVSVTIPTASVYTAHEARDEHLRSPDFFNSAEFPEITFQSTAVEKTGENTGTMTGELTMLGVTRPVTLEITFNKAADHPMSGTPTVGFSATGTLKRSEFGMSFGQGALGDEIGLIIQVEANKK